MSPPTASIGQCIEMNPFGQLPSDVMCHVRGLARMVGSKTPTARLIHDHVYRLPWVAAGIFSREQRNLPVVDIMLRPDSFGYHDCHKCDQCTRAVDYDLRSLHDVDRRIVSSDWYQRIILL